MAFDPLDEIIDSLDTNAWDTAREKAGAAWASMGENERLSRYSMEAFDQAGYFADQAGVDPTVLLKRLGLSSNPAHYADAGGSAADPFKKTVSAYKLFRMNERNPGQIFPLFVNANEPVPFGEWVDATAGPQAASGRVRSKLGELAFRPGWHGSDLPLATHIGGGGQPPTFRRPEQVWAEVEFPDEYDWQTVANERGRNAAGKIIPKNAAITDQIPYRGYYRYKTNPNMTGNWLISGNMKVNRLLDDATVAAVNASKGMADLPREVPLDLRRFGLDEMRAMAVKGLRNALRSV